MLEMLEMPQRHCRPGARVHGPEEAASVPRPRIWFFIREKLAYQEKTGTL
jgi:hypothetical protein